MDVTNQESVDAGRKHVEESTSGLWALVNNAGILGPNAPDDWLPMSPYEKYASRNEKSRE